jgi:putative transposase
MGICEATFFNWKKKYGGLGVSELRRLRQLDEENRKLKQLVADLSLDKAMLQDALQKSSETGPAQSAGRSPAEGLWRERAPLLRPPAMVLDGVVLPPSRPLQDAPLIKRMREIAEVRVRYGMRRIYVLLRREGLPVNHKRVHRLYVQRA